MFFPFQQTGCRPEPHRKQGIVDKYFCGGSQAMYLHDKLQIKAILSHTIPAPLRLMYKSLRKNAPENQKYWLEYDHLGS